MADIPQQGFGLGGVQPRRSGGGCGSGCGCGSGGGGCGSGAQGKGKKGKGDASVIRMADIAGTASRRLPPSRMRN